MSRRFSPPINVNEGATMRTRFALATLLCLMMPHWGRAQWAVIGAANVAQNTTTALNSIKQVYNSGQQLIAEYNIVRNTITQIENQVKNLQHMPQGLNLFDTILAYGSRIDSLLSQANTLSFELDQASRDFDRLYRHTTQIASPQAALGVRQQLLT